MTYCNYFLFSLQVKFPYPKAGTTNPTVQLIIYDISADKKVAIDAPTERVGEYVSFVDF